MLEIVYGDSRVPDLPQALATALGSVPGRGTLYLGYPMLATTDEKVQVDALLVSEEHGLIAFQFASGNLAEQAVHDALTSQQDRLYGVLESHLGRHAGLRRGRQLAVPIVTVAVLPEAGIHESSGDGANFESMSTIADFVQNQPSLDADLYRSLESALQRVSTIKPPKRRETAVTDRSRGAVLKKIEAEIANLDRWQKKAAIETPEGPQRIRGLAGSGKTIVLALKAAYLHGQHPDWSILVTFQTRSLYQQFEDLITRFTFEHINEPPDFDQLLVAHAWGSGWRTGAYQLMARAAGATPRDFNYAASLYGRDDAFRGVCQELLDITKGREVEAIFDAVLVDEAQDLPPEFFQLLHRFTKAPKRIVWGFDELQRLSEAAMPSTTELFGSDGAGQPFVSLNNVDGRPQQDIMLAVCYRNPPWTLAMAHALGFGIYRSEGLVQHFDDPETWLSIGYESLGSQPLLPGGSASLRRAPESAPGYFTELLEPEDAVVVRAFGGEAEQDSWIAQEIRRAIQDEEIEPDDVMVVLPSAYTAKPRASRLMSALAREGVVAHLVGVGSTADEFFVKGSVAISHIFRAKGNEAPMVFAADSQYAAGVGSTLTRRNGLFTAITRSRAWVRITGWGPDMAPIATEAAEVKHNNYTLNFVMPTPEALATLRRVHRDLSRQEQESLKRVTRNLEETLRALASGEVTVEHLPDTIRDSLLRYLRQQGVEGDLQ